MLNDIILIVLMCLLYGYWLSSQKAKEIALKTAIAYCCSIDVQMLDDYVALSSLSLKRNRLWKFQLQRSFVFEFSSTGNERYNGKILMTGRRVDSIYMDPYRIE
jgi:hypothetical protein